MRIEVYRFWDVVGWLGLLSRVVNMEPYGDEVPGETVGFHGTAEQGR